MAFHSYCISGFTTERTWVLSVDEAPHLHQYDPKAPWPVHKGGLLLTLYEHSLSMALCVLFMLSLTGRANF
jgi:hypothetical protein